MTTLSITLATLATTAFGPVALGTVAGGATTSQMHVLVNQDAPVRCAKSISIAAPADKVWAVLTDIDGWAAWQTEISNPKLAGPLQEGATFTWTTGGAGIHSTLHTVTPNAAFGWTGKTFGMRAIHNWTLTPVEGGTLVSVDESMEGLLARLLKKSFNKNLAKGMQTWLDLLKGEVERGR